MQGSKSHITLAILYCCLPLLSLLLSCGQDSPTKVIGETDLWGQGTIDPNRETDFFIGSASIDGTPEGHVEVWGYNLTVISDSRVSFDVVLVNESSEVLYPLVFFYVTKTTPQTVRVLNFDSKGFGSSFVFDFSDDLGGDNKLDPGEHTRPVRMQFELPKLTSFAMGFRITVGAPPVDMGCSTPYPIIIDPLPPETLETLRREFAAQNPNVCSGLNEYGFTFGYCMSHPVHLPDDADIEALIAAAIVTLTENSRFTGVSDPMELVATSHTLYMGRLLIYFGRQVYEGLQVVGTNIRVEMDSVGVRSIHGNHFPDICVPPQPIVSAIQAQESIIDLEIIWYDFGGNPRVHTVSEEDLQEQPTKIVLPHKLGGSIELRAAWRIPVGLPGSLSWYVYVDMMNKELLWIEQLFYT
jgi:hypothetical protein